MNITLLTVSESYFRCCDILTDVIKEEVTTVGNSCPNLHNFLVYFLFLIYFIYLLSTIDNTEYVLMYRQVVTVWVSACILGSMKFAGVLWIVHRERCVPVV